MRCLSGWTCGQDYRRHHAAEEETEAEVPSFLYAMPTRGSNRVFLEETCLVLAHFRMLTMLDLVLSFLAKTV